LKEQERLSGILRSIGIGREWVNKNWERASDWTGRINDREHLFSYTTSPPSLATVQDGQTDKFFILEGGGQPPNGTGGSKGSGTTITQRRPSYDLHAQTQNFIPQFLSSILLYSTADRENKAQGPTTTVQLFGL